MTEYNKKAVYILISICVLLIISIGTPRLSSKINIAPFPENISINSIGVDSNNLILDPATVFVEIFDSSLINIKELTNLADYFLKNVNKILYTSLTGTGYTVKESSKNQRELKNATFFLTSDGKLSLLAKKSSRQISDFGKNLNNPQKLRKFINDFKKAREIKIDSSGQKFLDTALLKNLQLSGNLTVAEFDKDKKALKATELQNKIENEEVKIMPINPTAVHYDISDKGEVKIMPVDGEPLAD